MGELDFKGGGWNWIDRESTESLTDSKDLKALRELPLWLSKEGAFQQEGQQMLRPTARVGLTFSSHIENTNMDATEWAR